MKDLKLLEIGTNVKFGDNFEFKGEISAITIREISTLGEVQITYEISFWKEAEIKTIWLYERNLKVTKEKRVGIGFINEKVD